jgi:predicted lipoprotein with Yx(FWY)xxD motif
MRMLRAAVPLISLTLILAACASTTGGTPGQSAQAPTPAAPSAAPSTAPSAAAGGITVNLADSTLGKVLADGAGRTLYVFTADSAGKSACSGSCADNWPALKSDAVPAVGSGLNAADFALITRDDGASQVTFHGMPVYYFAGDTAAGQVNGQGKAGKWFVVGGDGKMVAAASPAASPAASAPAAAGGVPVNLAKVSLGTVLTGGDKGMTLYLFTPDTADTSACTADCAATWPPLTSTAAPTLGTGLDAEDFKTITRDDGTKQVTFYGHPLYYFGGDTAAGETKGQSLGGKWYVVDAEGNAIK